MSEYEKKSLIKFLGLYLGSAFVFISAIAVLLYMAKVENLSELQREKLKSYTSAISAEIIDSHMRGQRYEISKNREFKAALIGESQNIIYSEIPLLPPLSLGFYERGEYIGVVDGGARLHHGVKYIVAETNSMASEKKEAALSAFWVWIFSFLLVGLLGFRLSKQFLKPIREEIEKLDNFVKASAHELNTPITSLVLSLDTLKKEIKDPSKIEYLKASAKMLSKIHDDLTYYLQRETLKKEEEWIDFAALANERGSFYARVASAKGVSVEVESESFIYRIDKTAANRLIDNLLSNAVKYSKKDGKIKINVSQNIITVEDEGIGINKEAKQKIFGKFQRATDIGGGFGLGLYIVKSVCDDYGIKIEVESEEGVGSRFRLIF